MNYPKSTQAGQFFWAILLMALFVAPYEAEDQDEQTRLTNNYWYGEAES